MQALLDARHVPAALVRDAMHPVSRLVDAGAPIAELLRAIIDEANPVVAVVSASGRLIGTVSERDLLLCLPPAGSREAAAADYARFLGLRAADVMTEAGLTVGDDDDLAVALDLLRDDAARALAVVDGEGRPRGLVTVASIGRQLRPPSQPLM
jgi:CBS-domain-containing membrane protein